MRVVLSLLTLATVTAAGCGGDAGGGGGRPDVVVTTTILGDVVTELLGDQADVSVVLPRGADPHEFAASTRQAEAMVDADLLVTNGGGFEHGLLDILTNAERDGTPTFAFLDHARPLADDPHFWTDPTRVADGVEALVPELQALDGVDADAVAARAEDYLAGLAALDEEVASRLAAVPPERRVLVTNHEVLGYFADRYGFEVIGAVIPSQSTSAQPSAGAVEDLAALLREEGVPAIFADVTGSTDLADALAREVGRDVQVVSLFTESLGEDGSGAETYVGLVRTDAELIADALA
jgi:zinc/manganese transport system substrate-binding protein